MLKPLLKGQRGFTLMELLAVIAILTVLSGIVAGAVTGIGASGQNARLAGDADTIGKSADRFFNDAFPQAYPVLGLADTPSDIQAAGDLGVRLVDFEAVLPGDPTKSFTPDFLKEVPDTAALVSWRIVTATGQVFFAEDGAQLVRPSGARLDVSAVTDVLGANATDPNDVSVQADYKLKLRMNKNEAALEILGMAIPAGYSIGGQSLAKNAVVGSLTGTLSTDNPWDAGQVKTFTGTLKATGLSDEWLLYVDYPAVVNTFTSTATVKARCDRSHKVSLATPSEEAAGALKIEMATKCDATDDGAAALEVESLISDMAQNQATENWELTIYGTAGGKNIITNPSLKGVYRWLATQHTTIDVGEAGQELFSGLTGNQAVVIKAATVLATPTPTPAPTPAPTPTPTATKLGFVLHPSTAAVGAVITPLVQVAVQDAAGNTITTATNSITIAIGTNPGGGTLSGTLTVNAVNGLASFGNLSINAPGNGYTLVASSGGLASGTSITFNITAPEATATKLGFVLHPSTATVGATITPLVQVAVQDAAGNTITTATNSITIAIGTNPGGGTLSGTLTVSAVNGLASFGNLSINAPGNGYTLVASSGGLASGASITFNITMPVPTVTATVTAGSFPIAVAANATTNRVYVANLVSRDVSVIDGASNAVTATVAVGSGPHAVAANATTNRIYVANVHGDSVSVIDGASNAVTATVAVGTPRDVAVNATTNRIYVANQNSNVLVIDGASNAVTATVAVGSNPIGVAVNATTNRIYVANHGSNTVSVIDGATNAVTATVAVGIGPFSVAVNATTNRIYVSNGASTVSVIDGASNAVTATVAVGSGPQGVAVNATTNRVYVANSNNNSVSVIDGASNAVTDTVAVGSSPIYVAVNATTNRIYVVNQNSNVSVIAH